MRTVTMVLAVVAAVGGTARAQGTADLYRESYAAEARGDFPGALASMDRMAGREGDYLFNLRRGWLLYLSGRHAEAQAPYARAVELEPGAVEARLGAMLPAMALRKWKEAERLCNEVLVLAPGDFTAMSRLAYIHYSQGRWEKAEAGYRKALSFFPGNVEMRAGLGWSLLKQGKVELARAELQRVLAGAPDHESAREGLGLR